MVQVFNDPGRRPIPRAPEIGTLRISTSVNTDLTIIQNYREKSVLSGFSSVGGLWAFIGGVFAWLFGTSLIRVLLGTCVLTLSQPTARILTHSYC